MLTLYIMVWPVISAIILAIIVATFWKDMRAAKKEGRKMV